MTETDHCTHIEQLPPIPSPDELTKLRRNGWKKRRKAKHPKIALDGGQHPQLGHIRLEKINDDYRVTFAEPGGEDRTALLSELCDREDLADDRLHFGWLVANLYHLDGLHVRESIPGPNEAMSESAPFLNAADDWRRWAIG